MERQIFGWCGKEAEKWILRLHLFTLWLHIMETGLVAGVLEGPPGDTEQEARVEGPRGREEQHQDLGLRRTY